MIGVSTLTPIVVAAGLGMCFKSTRGISVLSIAAISYIAPKVFLAMAAIGIIGFTLYKIGERL